jgi:U3 small nucleolar RNA-associated protein 12
MLKDAVTCVKFVKNTHYFFSCSKDKIIRYWDGDSFDLILEFSDFFGDIWSLDINSHGTVLLSVSADQSIKIYELTKEAVKDD